MRIYTIGTHFYDSASIRTFTNREEWEKAIDSDSQQQPHPGIGESMTVGIYEADDEELKHWSGMVWHAASKDRHADVDSIPDDWEVVEEQYVNYWYVRPIWARKNGENLEYEAEEDDERPEGTILAYTDGDFIDEDEEELIDSNRPIQYMNI